MSYQRPEETKENHLMQEKIPLSIFDLEFQIPKQH